VLPARLLGLVGDAPRDPEPGDRLVRVSTEVPAETPRRFLRRADDAARWFVQRGEAWTAGVGTAAEVRVPAARGGSRLERVRSALDVARDDVLHRDEEAPPLRLLGGFAFHAELDEDAAWSPFGAARFAAPALALHHGPDGTRLVGTGRVPQDTDAGEAVERARAALDEAVQRVDADPPEGPGSYQVPRRTGSTDDGDWRAAVREAVQAIEDEAFRKVVLARYLDLDAGTRPDPAVILANLRHRNPGSHVFLLEPEPGHAFLGASPEVLADVRGTTATATAVAGSIERGDDEDEDDRLARQLAGSEKDREEHRIVVDAMRRRLAAVADRVQVSRETRVLRLDTIQHLERELYAQLAPGTDVLDVVEALHPTPAVCGDPREAARSFLCEREPFERGWYAGPVGWVDVEGEGVFAPGLRSAVLDGDRWRLYAGAGVVEDSDPRAEHAETETKFRPVLDALGVRDVPAEATR
jgi:menaquinone-specific isochorismate synthase